MIPSEFSHNRKSHTNLFPNTEWPTRWLYVDHLGNTRVTFTTVDHSETKTVTLENATVAQDKANFLRYDNAKRINSTIFDRTNGTSAGYSQRLAGGGTTSNDATAWPNPLP
jgi:hypothetical protein